MTHQLNYDLLIHLFFSNRQLFDSAHLCLSLAATTRPLSRRGYSRNDPCSNLVFGVGFFLFAYFLDSDKFKIFGSLPI